MIIDQIETYFENVLTVSFYIAKFNQKAIGKLGEGMKREETLQYIANKLETKEASLRNNILEFEKRIKGSRGLTEITITKKRIYGKYLDTPEHELFEIVSSILGSINPQIQSKIINKSPKFDQSEVRIFNEYGNELFIENFYLAVEDNSHEIPDGIIFGEEYTTVLEGAKPLNRNKKFKNKFDFAQYINEILEDVETEKLFSNGYFWNWLSSYYFKQIFPGPSGGMQDIRYILSEKENYRYRHLLREAWRLYKDFREASIYLLSKQLNTGSDEIEQLASRATFLNKNTIQICGEFYFMREGEGYFLKKNSTTRTEPGNMRRLEECCKGINLNYFIPTMDYEKFKQMILKIPEFKNWISN